jgi:hypothetical protein
LSKKESSWGTKTDVDLLRTEKSQSISRVTGDTNLKLSLSVALLACVLAITPYASLAHHSHGNYDIRNYTELEGTVARVIWLNPHVWIHLNVDDGNGATEVWALEGGSIHEIMRHGWKKDSLQNGDRISVRCHALRDGAKGCLLGYVTLEGGEERVFD